MTIILLTALGSLLFSQPVLQVAIKLAYRFSLLDHPSPRRRHRKPTPIVGGLAIFFTWLVGMGAYSFLEPTWFAQNAISLFATCVSVGILIALGTVDDVVGLNPKSKLLFQFLAAGVVIGFEPRLHALALYWRDIIGFIIWPLIAIWIVGLTNAINLIDGLDGLAGGTSLLVSASIAILSVISDGTGALQGVSMIVLAASTLGFLRFNWSPAKVFLGDNGSLPLGFMIALNSLTCHPPTRSWIMVASVVLMMGYPILDTGLAVWRRHINGLALFKADRNHLHFRVQRLGLNVGQTAFFLLSVSLYLQVTALSLNLLPTYAVLPSLAMVLFSVFGILYVVRCIERSRVVRLSTVRRSDLEGDAPRTEQVMAVTVAIPLAPIFEVGMFEEKSRYRDLVHSLETMLRASAATNEEVMVSRDQIVIICRSYGTQAKKEIVNQIKQRYDAKLQTFCTLMGLQCSTSKIPFTVKNVA